MQKKIFLYLFILAICICACTNENATKTKTANNVSEIKFKNDVYDFGKIKQGEKVNYEFEFKNVGDKPLIISNASASCGCTIPEWPKEPIGIGESGKIKVVFNSAGKSGLQDKLITIMANTSPTETKLHLIGEILSDKNN